MRYFEHIIIGAIAGILIMVIWWAFKDAYTVVGTITLDNGLVCEVTRNQNVRCPLTPKDK